MNTLKLTQLQPQVEYEVLQWDLVYSKYGNRFLLKITDGEKIIQTWSNNKLFNELSALGKEKVNFTKVLGYKYKFKIVSEGEFNGHKTVNLETCLE